MCAPALLVTEVGWKMHSEYLTLLKDAIRQADLAKSMQRYQLAVDVAKVHLDLAARPERCWCPLEWWSIQREQLHTTASWSKQTNKKKKRSCASWKALCQKLNHQTVTYLIPFTKKQWNWENKKKGAAHYPHFFLPSFSSPPHDINQGLFVWKH